MFIAVQWLSDNMAVLGGKNLKKIPKNLSFRCSFIGVRQRGVDLQHWLADRGKRVRLRRRAHLRRPQCDHVLRVQRLYVSNGAHSPFVCSMCHV